ncbi:hypothetical protein [uncultured Endozoicomonas sp.]|uniref:hypothetical protein n=1 Tax=uncultured Endozoicomonas sp. TaxID=432652 RepID=UPI00263539D4|nr:hypothetical protein [uncultured Endozoicomonas sp.]
MKIVSSLTAFCTILFASSLFAASNPAAPGTKESSGTFTITYYNGTKILLYGLQDIELTSDDANTSPNPTSLTGQAYTPFCVAETPNTGPYQIALSSDTDFALKNSSTTSSAKNIPYTLTVKSDTTDIGTWGTGSGNTKKGEFIQSPALTPDSSILSSDGPYTCSSTNTTGRSIAVALTGTDAADAGIYTDTVTVTVAPY